MSTIDGNATPLLHREEKKQSMFRLYSNESWVLLEGKRKVNKLKLKTDGTLVDGKIQFDKQMKASEDETTFDPDLAEENTLSETKFGKIPAGLIGKPIEEIDTHIKDKTFVVINSRLKIFRFSSAKSIFLLDPLNPIRKACIFISTHFFFDLFIMATILVNCVFLALTEEYEAAEYTFLIIYTVEVLLNVLSRGLIMERHTYLRDAWNWLDIVVVFLSFILLIVQSVSGSHGVNVGALRAFRVFRVLKTISIFPGLKIITGALLKSITLLFEVATLTLACLSIFSIFGLQLYVGVLHNKCVKTVDWSVVNATITNYTIDLYYNWFIKQKENWMVAGTEGVYWSCGNGTGAGQCEKSPYAGSLTWVCLGDIGENPNWGFTNFDSIGMALLSSFQLLILDSWADLYNKIIRTSGSLNILFFILVVFLGSLYLVNLMLVVVTMSYEEEADKFKKNSKFQKCEENHQEMSEDRLDNSHRLEDGNPLEIVKFDTDDQPLGNEFLIGENWVDRNFQCCAVYCPRYTPWLRFQNVLYSIVTDPLFDVFITLCIFANTIVMSTEHYPTSKAMTTVLNISNYVFTAVFTLEAICKTMSMGKEYFQSGWNIFDLLVVTASLIDIGVDEIDSLSIFRAFRLFRIFKLAQSWRTMRILLTIIFSSISAVGNLTLILIIVIFIFAVVGMQLFRGSYTAEVFGSVDAIPRWNFESFRNSLVMVFQIICGEFIGPLWDCMRANGSICIVVFVPIVILGNFMVLNLFLALLVNSFASDSLEKDDTEDDAKIKLAVDRLRSLFRWKNVALNEVDQTSQLNHSLLFDSEENDSVIKQDRSRIICSNTIESLTPVIHQPFDPQVDDEKEDASALNKDGRVTELMLENCCSLSCYHPFSQEGCLNRWSCCTCPVEENYGANWQRFRYTILRITEHKIFEGFVLVIIIASSISLAFEDIYLNNNMVLKDFLNYTNIIFTILFTLELLLKNIALGIRKYFSSFWTILDFCIVCISWIDLIASLVAPEINQISAFRTLRILRGLRPLRTVNRWENMKIVVNALLHSIPSIINVFLVCMVFWLIFSILGVQFFKGKFFRCQNNNHEDLSYLQTPNKSECLRLGYVWKNRKINFDNVGQGFLALYQVATFAGWTEILKDAIDVTDVDRQPVQDNSTIYYVYFIIFIIIGSFYVFNLFVGVIIDNFKALKDEYEGNAINVFLTVSQQHYYNTWKKLSKKKPQKIITRPNNYLQGLFYDVSVSRKFETTIILLIFFNMIVMMVEHYKQSENMTQALEIINMIFIIIFTLEATVKIIGLRKFYFKQAWNIFDFIIVFLSLLGVIMANVMENTLISPNLLRIIRVFRINRLLRLIRAAKGIRKLIFALVISMPALFNIGALLLLLVFMYAIIGMSMFGNVKYTGALDDLVNFENFERSMLLLFRLTTRVGWNEILHSLLITTPDCNSTHVTRAGGMIESTSNGDCSIDWLAIIFMSSFVLLVNLIVINMYVAVILDNYTEAQDQEDIGITQDDFDNFYTVWKQYDPQASQYIKFDQLSNFLAQLGEPLGLPKPNTIDIVTLDLPIVEGNKLHYLDILLSIVRHVLGDVEDSEEFLEMKKRMEEKFRKTFPARNQSQVITSTMRHHQEEVAAKILQRAWRYRDQPHGNKIYIASGQQTG